MNQKIAHLLLKKNLDRNLKKKKSVIIRSRKYKVSIKTIRRTNKMTKKVLSKLKMTTQSKRAISNITLRELSKIIQRTRKTINQTIVVKVKHKKYVKKSMICRELLLPKVC